jgi:hypothetical protein
MVQLSPKLIPFCGLEPAWHPLKAQLAANTFFTAVNKLPGVPEQAPGFGFGPGPPLLSGLLLLLQE